MKNWVDKLPQARKNFKRGVDKTRTKSTKITLAKACAALWAGAYLLQDSGHWWRGRLLMLAGIILFPPESRREAYEIIHAEAQRGHGHQM